MLEGPAEAVESPAHDHIHLSTARILQYVVQGRSAVFGSADDIGVLDRCPASCSGVAPQLVELILIRLIRCADSGVEGSSHVASLVEAGGWAARMMQPCRPAMSVDGLGPPAW